ncbi:hypothetical protein TVNIR_3028 [Thioalkalivibrio nitratireducens DSM 14787]|uniref:Uncharacterized protein n=1 Tax=Thioalkalivibrio nitratireducens (strain DSM 14787 / UNIQEM 213 / ALEN2) TaxID=1255043 RepID=L0DYI7_THIND|nr:hypothetical protein TVNIR_3028 [Thioalkalivibrio nitratireducens DSM 14787]
MQAVHPAADLGDTDRQVQAVIARRGRPGKTQKPHGQPDTNCAGRRSRAHKPPLRGDALNRRLALILANGPRCRMPHAQRTTWGYVGMAPLAPAVRHVRAFSGV